MAFTYAASFINHISGEELLDDLKEGKKARFVLVNILNGGGGKYQILLCSFFLSVIISSAAIYSLFHFML